MQAWLDPLLQPGMRGWIYFLQPVGGGPIKIGRADDLRTRLLGIQGMNPAPLIVLGVIEVNWTRKPFAQKSVSWVEANIHERFKAHRIRFEWFEPSPDIFDYLSRFGILIGETVDTVTDALKPPPAPKRRRRRWPSERIR